MPRRMEPLTSDLVEDLPSACVGCAFWESRERLPRHCGAKCDVELSRGWIDYVQAQWGDCGRAAIEDGVVLGFVKYAPPGYLPQAEYFPASPPSDDAVFLACMHLVDEARHLGLGKLLLHAALRDLYLRGERAVEAYGFSGPSADLPVISAEFLSDSGFVVERSHPEFPLMRLKLKSLATLTENVEAVLQGLHVPLRVHKRVTAPYANSEC